VLKLKKSHYDQIVSQAKQDLPNETCGLIAGKNNETQLLIPIPNAKPSPVMYQMDGKALLKAFKLIDEQKLELLAIYHSHTASPAYPSQTDIELALYPEAYYLIVSLQKEPEMRNFKIVDKKITEEKCAIID